MDWNKLLTNKRLGQEYRHSERHDDRTEFKRDYDRLIFSAPFRRLQNKTQVFPLPGSIFVHNRLTHSLEVASVGMSLGNDVASRIIAKNPHFIGTMLPEIGTIVSTACLAHDMGNPPFGHSGEKAIQTFFTEGKGAYLQERVSPELWSDITHFEGNANAFRLLAHRFKGRREGGFVMTYTTLASIVKYPVSSTFAGKKGKFGFFQEETPIYQKIVQRIARRDEKAFLSNQCKEIEENNRMGKTRDLFKKIRDAKGIVHQAFYFHTSDRAARQTMVQSKSASPRPAYKPDFHPY